MMNVSLTSIEKFAIELQTRSTAIIVLESLFMLAINVASFFGNALVLFAVYRNSNLSKSAPSKYIISLAVSDLLMSLLGIPYTAAVLILGRWPFNDAICQFQGFFVLLLCAVSLQTLAVTAINRYFKIVRSRAQYNKIFNLRNTKITIALLWLLAVLAPAPYVIAGHRFFLHTGKAFSTHDSESLYKGYGAYLVLFYVTIPLIIIISCYTKVFLAVRKHNRNLQSHLAERAAENGQGVSQLTVEEIRVTNTLLVVVLGFLTCWTPVVTIDLIDFVNGDWKLSRQVYVAYTCFGFASTSINPVIYGIMNRSFRKEYKKILSPLVRKVRRFKVSNTSEPVEAKEEAAEGEPKGNAM